MDNDRCPVDPWRPTREERQAIWTRINHGTASRNDCFGLVYMADHLEDEVAALRAERDELVEMLERRAASHHTALAELEGMRASLDAETRRADDNDDARMKAEAERDRLISANDTLVARIEDLTEGYALEDTCPRVQCLTTSRRLKAERDELRAALTELILCADALLDPPPDMDTEIAVRDAAELAIAAARAALTTNQEQT